MNTETTHKIARELVLSALKMDDEDGEIPELPSELFALQDSEQLTRDQVMQGVCAMMLALNLRSGNSGGRNLYELLDLYLRNPEATAAINAVIQKHGKRIN